MGANTGLAKEFKDIFEVGGVPAFNQFYYYGIFIWKYLYKGFYNAWHLVPVHSIEQPVGADGKRHNQREMFRLNLAKAASQELAGLIWSEQCNININGVGFEPTETEPEDKYQRFINKVLDDNNFHSKMQGLIEQTMALGGGAFKVWCEMKHDENGEEIPGTQKIKIGYCMADQFIPTKWDNSGVQDGVFISRQAKDGYYYTRLEWHKWNGETYVITNDLYRSEMKREDTRESQDILGYRYPLEAIYPLLNPETTITGLEQSLFSYFKTPIANNIDDNSPLGVSIYANALSTLHAIDICYDSFVREFQLGKKRIIVPARAIRTVVDPQTQAVRRYFDATDEVYEAFSTDDTNDLKIQDNSVELRIEEHVAALNAFLSILCLQLGFSASTFSFDAKEGLKTATEVVSENSKTYKTVKNCQNAIEPAIYRLVNNIYEVARLYDVEFDGEKVSSWFKADESIDKSYCCNIYWDDAIIQDRQTNINEGILLTSNGLMSKKAFMTKVLGMTPEQAEAEIKNIAEEQNINTFTIDKLDAFTTE
nr:MAG TPA: portal protein [Caudoviricetes sp.]